MQLGWIDFSKDERNKVLNVIHLLDEPGAVDELGIGIIRDAFADYFFPGTSTVQTRAKYFLIVPYALKEAGDGKYGNNPNTIMKGIDDDERRCRDILLRTSSDGVIGSLVPKSWVLRTPSNIYWNGIKSYGIFCESSLSISEYVRESVLQRKLKLGKKLGNCDKNDDEKEIDDTDAGDITNQRFWNLYGVYKSDWRDNLTIELLPEESEYLKQQIMKNQRNTLLSYILKNHIDMDKYDSFAALSEAVLDKVPEDLSKMIVLANDFNKLVGLATTRYNLIISGGQNERAVSLWNTYGPAASGLAVDLNETYNALRIRNRSLRAFLSSLKAAFVANDIARADELITRQEVYLKGPSRAKLKRVGEYPPQNWVGISTLDYRFTPTRRIVRDIYDGEAQPNV